VKSEKSKCFIVIEFLSVECFAKIMQMSAMKACFQIAECSLSYAKIMQIECRTSSLLECFAEMQLILCKDKKIIWKTNEMRTKIFERKFPVGQLTASN